MMNSVTCQHCGKSFEKLQKEINRSIKLGRKQYCSKSCAKSGEETRAHLASIRPGFDISAFSGNRRDEYSGLREFVRRAKARGHETNLSLEYLKSLWENQNKKCAYSGIELTLPIVKGINDPIFTASLDRKDSNQGYIEGNVQFVSIAINYMKNSMTHEQANKIISLIRQT